MATQSDAEEQATPRSVPGTPSSSPTLHAPGPAAGSLELRMSSPEAITHMDGDGQEIPARSAIDEAWTSFSRVKRHCGRRAAGFFDVTTFPAISTATHSDREGHDTASRSAPMVIEGRTVSRSTFFSRQFRPGPLGSLDATTRPDLSLTTQN